MALIGALPPHGSTAPVWPVTHAAENTEDHGRCPDCGTDRLPSGAVLATDTEETVAARIEALRTDRRLAAYRQARAEALTAAQRRAIRQVLATHAAEVDALATRYSQVALANLDACYPDVCITDVVHPDEVGGALAG